ncbi:MAG: protein tyrosine phosphatase [Pseudomonadota bacterium]
MAKPDPLYEEDLQTTEGRRKAWSGLLLGDHGFLRYAYSNVHALSPRMWRAFQPAPFHVRKFAKMGVRTIINLRGESPTGFYLLEKEACARLGVKLVNFKVFSREAPSRETLLAARTLFQDIDYPALMHCKSGSDRVGLMSALYLHGHENRPLTEALKQLSLRYGHIKQGKTGVLDHFFQSYQTYAAQTPIAFYDWVEKIYDPASVKADFKATRWGSAVTEGILRRE